MQMGLELSVSHRLEQKLSPQMIQSLKLLQVTALQLEAMVTQELDVNPLLEQEEDIEEVSRDEDGKSEGDSGEEEEKGEVDGLDASEEPGKKDEVDWEAFFEDGFDPGYRRTEEQSQGDSPLERLTANRKTLQDHLLEQLHDRDVKPEIETLVEYLIQCLDDDGYLAHDEELLGDYSQIQEENQDFLEIQRIIAGEKEESRAKSAIREAFHILRSLDPPGVGAKTLQECLQIQIYRKGGVSDLAKKIVDEEFDSFKKLKIAAIAKKMELSPETVQKAIREIGQLEPKPGHLITENLAAPIIPDVLVEVKNGEIVLLFNDKFSPSLRISSNYSNLLRKGSKASTEEKKFVRDKLNSASWLIKAIEQRKSTIIKVMSAIIKSQPEFFSEGPTHLRPLILQNIADQISMHISTVSRVINGKFVQTPHGIFELKYFFSSGVGQETGEDISSVTIKDYIRQLVEAEPTSKPLSDQKIADLLKKKGYEVARRTVAKYRDQLEILPARLRKQF